EVHVILASARVDDELGSAPRAGRPVGGQYDKLGSQKFQRASCFRKTRVVADVDSDAAERKIEDAELLVARRQKAINPEKRKMDLPIVADDAIRSDKHRGIVEVRTVLFDEAYDRMRSRFITGIDDRL